jgi:multidrug efflux pump subunit AcrA (membrane-fusion protein)
LTAESTFHRTGCVIGRKYGYTTVALRDRRQGFRPGVWEILNMNMPWHRARRHCLPLLAAITILVPFCAARGQTSSSTEGDQSIVKGIGTPSEEHRVCFEGNTDGNDVIAKVLVKPGQPVKTGDVLMTEDTDEAEAELGILKAAAEATGAIEEQEVNIAAKSTLVKKLQEMHQYGLELIQDQLDVDVAKARKKAAEEDHKQRELQYERQLVKVQHMTLRSPIDGEVETVSLFSGEVVDVNSNKNGACYIVSNDPLWVELHVTADQALRLKLHDKVGVAFSDLPDQWHDGEVIFLDPMVEYVGQTRTVRVSVANPDHRPSGLQMLVRLPAQSSEAQNTAVGLAKP